MVSDRRRILYIGGGREAQETLEKANALGLEIIYIQQKDKFREALLQYVHQVVLIDYHDSDILIPLARTLMALFPFAGALSLSEDALVPTAQVSEALGLPGNSLQTVLLLKDKARMRQRLNEIGFSPVTARIGSALADMQSFVQEVGLPVIIKPVDASGSLGVFRVEQSDQLAAVWQEVQKLELERFLMEEYLDGPEYSVEAFSFHGNHIILACTDKRTLPNFVEIGHSIPAQLDEETRRRMAQFVTAFLDAVNLQEGPSHTEVKLTSKGPRIIESHNRPGGDRINEMVRAACGVDMKTMAFAWACGLTDPLTSSPPLQRGAAIRFFTPPPGGLREISGTEEAMRTEGVLEWALNVKAGDTIPPIRESYDRVGHVLATGADVREAIRRCEQAIRLVKFVTE